MSQELLKQALGRTIEGIKMNPNSASAVFRAQTELRDGVSCAIKVRDFDTMIVDEPPSLGGNDSAMSPVELLLGALGTCQEIMYAAYAAVMGIPVVSLKVDLKGYLDLRGLFGMDESVVSGFRKIVYETRIESPASDEALRHLVAVVESHCPVLDTLTRPVEVKGTVFLNGVRQGEGP